ncbi:MAG TPA: AAA family ATPase [Polyangiaceae bacterium]
MKTTRPGFDIHAAMDAAPETLPPAWTVGELVTKKFEPRELLLGPWLQARSANMVYGPRGVGKSYLVQTTAVSIATGTTLIERWTAFQRRRVLFIDGELPGSELQRRFALLISGYKVQPDDYLRLVVADELEHGLPSVATAAGAEIVLGLAEHWRSDIVVFDSISTLVGGLDENSAEAWQPVQDLILALRRIAVGVLLVHHTNKVGGQRGTSRREDILDSILALRAPADADEGDGARFVVGYEKHRAFRGGEALPFTAELVTDATGARWRTSEPSEGRLALVARLTADGKSLRAIEQETGIPRSTIQRLIERGKKEKEGPK